MHSYHYFLFYALFYASLSLFPSLCIVYASLSLFFTNIPFMHFMHCLPTLLKVSVTSGNVYKQLIMGIAHSLHLILCKNVTPKAISPNLISPSPFYRMDISPNESFTEWIIYWQNFHLVNCPLSKTSGRQNVFSVKYPFGKTSIR